MILSTSRRLQRLALRATIPALVVLSAGLFLTLQACSRQPAEQAATQTAAQPAAEQPAAEPQQAPAEEESSGSFHLELGGDVQATLEGTASCVLDEETRTLRATLDSHGASDFLYYVDVPGYDDNTADYSGTFEMSGGTRADGPVAIGITREDDDTGFFKRQLTLEVEGTYSGTAGEGTVKGQVECGLPPIDNDDSSPNGAADAGGVTPP